MRALLGELGIDMAAVVGHEIGLMEAIAMNSRTWMAATVLVAALVAGGSAAQAGAPAGYLSSGENLAKIQVGSTTGKEVEQLLGPPHSMSKSGRRDWVHWEYRLHDQWPRITVWIAVSTDGIVREVVQLRERERQGTT